MQLSLSFCFEDLSGVDFCKTVVFDNLNNLARILIKTLPPHVFFRSLKFHNRYNSFVFFFSIMYHNTTLYANTYTSIPLIYRRSQTRQVCQPFPIPSF